MKFHLFIFCFTITLLNCKDPVQLMQGSNHLQMRNDSKMGDAVKLIFENGIDGSKFFKTDFR